MAKASSFLPRVMLILGGLLVLAGLGWGLWSRLHSPPPPIISEAGAVVLAETSLRLPTRTITPAPAASSIPRPSAEMPTPALLPEWEASMEGTTPTATRRVSLRLLPPPTLTPTPTWAPTADQPPTHIIAPAIKLDARVVPMSWETVDRNGVMVSVWVVPKNAAGWLVNSALPGSGGNTVLSGHHNIAGKVFRHVVDLQLGDVITLYVGDTPYTYIVTEKYILKEAGMPLSVRQKNAQWIMPTGDERLTLVTCWPYEWPGNTHRVIVVARPPDYFTEETGSGQQ